MSTWFENIKTGVKWDISDERVISNLTKDENYREISKPKEKKEKKKKV